MFQPPAVSGITDRHHTYAEELYHDFPGADRHLFLE
jgi:hypothetical protein